MSIDLNIFWITSPFLKVKNMLRILIGTNLYYYEWTENPKYIKILYSLIFNSEDQYQVTPYKKFFAIFYQESILFSILMPFLNK